MTSIVDEGGRKAIEEFLQTLARPEDSLLPLLFPGQPLGESMTSQKLRVVCRLLFKEIERLGRCHASLTGKSESTGTLSGLEELYVGPDQEHPLDAETLWGQVELQNTTLRGILKASESYSRNCKLM